MLVMDNQDENVFEAQILHTHCAHANIITSRQGSTLAKRVTLLPKQRQILKPTCL